MGNVTVQNSIVGGANSNGGLDIGTPTMEDTASATERVNEAFHVQP